MGTIKNKTKKQTNKNVKILPPFSIPPILWGLKNGG